MDVLNLTSALTSAFALGVDADDKIAFGKVLATVLGLVICAIVGYVSYRAVHKPAGLALAPGEEVLGELFVSTREVQIPGLHLAGSGLEGKLVLTSQRLLYCTFDQRRIGLEVPAANFVNAKPGEKGLVLKDPSLALSFKDGPGGQPRTVTFAVLAAASPSFFQAALDNPNTAESFARLLDRWRLKSGG